MQLNTKSLIGIVLVFCCFFHQDATAQFWKKKSKPNKVLRNNNDNADLYAEIPKATSAPKPIEYPNSKIKIRYRIDVLLPLYLSELVQENKVVFEQKLPEKVIASYHFYEGILLAKDSLNKLGYSIDINIVDVTQDNQSPEQLVKLKTLVGADLIIGFLPSNQLKTIANYAQKNKINFISALSAADGGVTNNPFFTILQPTLKVHCQKIRQLHIDRYPGKTILFLADTSNSLDSMAYALTIGNNTKKTKTVIWGNNADSSRWVKWLDTNLVNPILVPIMDERVADSALQQMIAWFPNYRFQILGMPSWGNLPIVKSSFKSDKISIVYSVPFDFLKNKNMQNLIINQYKKQQGTKPDDYVFRGFETIYWFSYLLHSYGTIFNTHLSDTSGAAFTPYDIHPQWSKNNELQSLVNENVFIIE